MVARICNAFIVVCVAAARLRVSPAVYSAQWFVWFPILFFPAFVCLQWIVVLLARCRCSVVRRRCAASRPHSDCDAACLKPVSTACARRERSPNEHRERNLCSVEKHTVDGERRACWHATCAGSHEVASVCASRLVPLPPHLVSTWLRRVKARERADGRQVDDGGVESERVYAFDVVPVCMIDAASEWSADELTVVSVRACIGVAPLTA
jgi:hypothetical protein